MEVQPAAYAMISGFEMMTTDKVSKHLNGLQVPPIKLGN